MAYLDKSTNWTITAETSFGVAPAIDVVADYVELINPTMDANTETIDREVLKNSLVKAQSLLGKETSSGSMDVELSSALGTEGAKLVNGDLLYEAGIGKRIGDVIATDGTIASGVITFTVPGDADLYEVGQSVAMTGGANPTYAIVRSIDTGVSMTVAPVPADDSTTFGGMVSYIINRPEDPQTTLTVQEYLESGSGRIEYTYNGVVVSDVSIAFPVANIVKASFSLAGAGFDVEEDGVSGGTVADRGAACVDVTPYIAKNMSFIYDGVTYDIDSLDVKVSSDVYDTSALTTDGISNKTITGKSEVGGTFGREYKDTELFAKYQAGTTGEIYGEVSNGTTSAIVYMPKVALTAATKSVDSSIYKESLTFVAMTSTCGDGVSEDAFTLSLG